MATTNLDDPRIIEFAYGFVLDAAARPGAVPESVPEPPVADAPVNVDGDVVEMGTRKPLADFVVRIDPPGIDVHTDATGHYAFRGVPVGGAKISVSRPGYDRAEDTIDVKAGEVTTARLWLRNQSYAEQGIVGVYHKESTEVTHRAISMDGERYSELDNAFAYRKKLTRDCTCNGREPAGLAPIDISLDTTLRPGDVVATTTGLVAFSGAKPDGAQPGEFTPVASYPGLTATIRARLGEMKVAPVHADVTEDYTASIDVARAMRDAKPRAALN